MFSCPSPGVPKILVAALLIAVQWGTVCLAQGNPKIESLQAELDSRGEKDTAYVNFLLETISSILWQDPEQALLWSEDAIELSRSLNSRNHLASSYYSKGAALTIVHEYDSALSYLHKCQDIAIEVGDSLKLAKTRIVIAVNYDEQGQFLRSLEYNSLARDYFEGQNNQLELSRLSNNIGNIFLEIDRLDDALENYQEALATAQAIENKLLESVVSGNIGNVLRAKNEPGKAFPYLLAAYRINTENDITIGHATVCFTLGEHFLDQQNPERAKQYLDEALQLARTTGDTKSEAEALLRLSEYLEMQGQHEQALSVLDSSKSIAAEIGSDILISEVLESYHQLYKAQGKPELALKNYEAYIALRDSIEDFEKERQIKMLEDEHEFQQQELQIAQLEKEARSQEDNQRLQNGILAALAAALGIVTLLLILAFRNSRRRKSYNRILKKRSQLIDQQRQQILLRNEELSKKNERLETLNNEIEGLVAIVAHDLRAPLTSTEAMLDMLLQPDLPQEMREKFGGMIRNATKKGKLLIEDILTISRIEWGQPDLDWEEVDLRELVSETGATFRPEANEKDIDLKLLLPDAPLLARVEKVSLERILENLISNAIKFSPKARRVWVELEEGNNERVHIRIRDEGPGISQEDQKRMFGKFQRLSAQPTAGESSTGLGLSIVKALVERLGGSITVKSVLGKGTEFHLDLPKGDV